MFKFIRKHRLFFDILTFIVFGLCSYFYFDGYFNGEFENSKQKNMQLFGAIVLGLLSLIKLVESFEGFKKKKQTL
jgi:hypothetical protein